ncbi:23S rRNA (pseudouridine(1915)-N(3))-methyltransferase RlmH [Ureaplasma sp. ES3154-GEN]|uniref:23S rRNA (pseudouridine(1915)-N(3))-methyltransferase RlmH n=1 Tax=Ureaplasma sp. ES3154-GEN TaxID=2984844 RepID=UPI0021E7FDA4|nr:23S rRNA (pseudouridine(1915)-N(3))-methyltransferase RlmH [Ureaplasma sp. ES3154-GEN]MCV3743770.1 23S rRNA (pseudouridine(1915)-N(3))-methyltransferase RlmH [Ureaplasma sp. ES3154-GEN]
MYIKIITIGKIKTDFWNQAIKEYATRLSRFVKVDDEILNDQREPKNLTPALIEQIKKTECEGILKKIKPEDFVICLAIEGKQLTSEQLADFIAVKQNLSRPLVFIIGGSHGVSDAIYKRADFLLSMSKMTFAHNLAKVILYEQIYRAFSIINNTKYHK